MGVDVIKLLQDYQIPYTTTHHHCTPGWVNVHCPFCPGKQNFHLGINLTTQACHCWRCGSHNFVEVVAALLSVSYREAVRIIKEYASLVAVPKSRKTVVSFARKEAVLPEGLLDTLLPVHVKYLESRGFDVEELKVLWKIRSVGFVGRCKYRIFIPVIYENRIVSYQCRATSDNVKPRYLTAKKEYEAVHHKYVLYGWDYVVNKSAVAVVEGPTDVWRIGPGAVATFGLQYTLMQVLCLSKFDKVYIVFDNEPQAQYMARKLAYEIELAGDSTVYVVSDYSSDDPGSMPPEDVEKLRGLLKTSV